MAYHVQFINLTQSEFDDISSKSFANVYFTSDTHRIYKGSDLYAATTFDQLNFSQISASGISVDGHAVSLEGHGHSIADISGLQSELSGYASSGHTHFVSDITDIVPISFLTQSAFDSLVSADASTIYFIEDTNSIYKGSELYATTRFDQLEFSSIEATSMTVGGKTVSLTGHTHSAADVTGLTAAMSGYASVSHSHVISDITDLQTTLSGFASSGHVHEELSGITSSSIDKTNGGFVSLSASAATFGDINVTGTASLNATNVSASALTAYSGAFDTIDASVVSASAISVGGTSVALEGHSHSEYASASHLHDISDVNGLSTILSGITSSSIEKDAITADVGNFRLLSVSGSLNFAVNNISANSMTVNGSQVAIVGHTHSVADMTDLSTVLSAYASASHLHAVSDISGLEATLSDYALVSHSHLIADVTGLQSALDGLASSGHSHVELAGITSSTIGKDSGHFVTLSASTATFETMTVSGSATFDITNLVADAITVSDLNLTGTLSVSSTAISAMTVTDMSVTGTLTLNSKSIATEEYVLAQISAAIGQILASAY